jgi:hypothetical protein
MKMLTADKIIGGLAYATRLRCSSCGAFTQKVSDYFKQATIDDLPHAITNMVISLSNYEGAMGNKEALNLLIARDLASIGKTFSSMKLQDPLEEMSKHFEIYKETLHQYELDLSGVQLFLVDSYPHPYEGLDFFAMNFDADDEQKYGITPGLYFKKVNIRPILSSYLVAHELIHQCFSRIPTGELARGLEDGICDFIAFFLCMKTLGYEITKNVFVNMRFAYPIPQSQMVYTEALRQAIILYKIYGLRGLIQILTLGYRKGRSFLKEIEQVCLQGEYSKMTFLDKGWRIRELNRFADFFIGFPHSMVASPLACIIAEKMEKGDKVGEFLREQNILDIEGRKALRELSDRLYLILLDGENIVYDETKAYVSNGLLRYELRV